MTLTPVVSQIYLPPVLQNEHERVSTDNESTVADSKITAQHALRPKQRKGVFNISIKIEHPKHILGKIVKLTGYFLIAICSRKPSDSSKYL